LCHCTFLIFCVGSSSHYLSAFDLKSSASSSNNSRLRIIYLLSQFNCYVNKSQIAIIFLYKLSKSHCCKECLKHHLYQSMWTRKILLWSQSNILNVGLTTLSLCL
jgi:hypothetical protein